MMPSPCGGDRAGPGAASQAGASRADPRTCKAARDGVTRGLRSLYSDVVAEPLPDDMKALLDRLGRA